VPWTTTSSKTLINLCLPATPLRALKQPKQQCYIIHQLLLKWINPTSTAPGMITQESALYPPTVATPKGSENPHPQSSSKSVSSKALKRERYCGRSTVFYHWKLQKIQMTTHSRIQPCRTPTGFEYLDSIDLKQRIRKNEWLLYTNVKFTQTKKQ
jgi:hypothetical protein